MTRPHSWKTIISLFLLLLAGTVNAEPPKEVIEQAKKEGKLVFYTVLSAPESQALLGAFQKKYPFLQTELFRLGAEKMRSKILIEARAGRHVFDVTSMDVVETGVLLRQGILAPYKAVGREAIPTGLKDEEGYWTAIYVRQFVLAYNTKLLSQKEAPKDWWDLLEPKWKGKIGMDQEETEWYASLVTYWGKEKAQKLMKGLAAQNPSIRRGHTLIAELTAFGEFPLSLAYASRLEEMKAKGSPIDWVDTTDPIVTSPSVISLSSHALHPNAGRLFIEFVFSPEAQMLLSKSYRVTPHRDVPPLSPRLDLKRLKTFFVNPKIADRYQEFQKEYHEIFRQ